MSRGNVSQLFSVLYITYRNWKEIIGRYLFDGHCVKILGLMSCTELYNMYGKLMKYEASAMLELEKFNHPALPYKRQKKWSEGSHCLPFTFPGVGQQVFFYHEDSLRLLNGTLHVEVSCWP